MQIKSTPSLDAFLAPRAAPQAARGNGDNESFSRLMQERRDQAAATPSTTRRPTADTSNDTYDMRGRQSASTSDASAAKATDASRDTSDADSATTRGRDGDTTRSASEAKSLAARKAESAKLGRRPGQATDGEVATTDRASSTDPITTPGEGVDAPGASPSDWIAAMAGVAPKQAPIVEPEDGDAASAGTAPADLAPVVAPGTRIPGSATLDPSAAIGSGKQPTIGIIPSPQPVATEAPVSAENNPISLTPDDATQKSGKETPPLQAGDPTIMAMLQSSTAANEAAKKSDRSYTTDPVANADGNVGAAAAAAAATTPQVAQAADVTAVQIATSVHAPEFKEALGVQISMMAKDGIQHAELHLNPADMGPISVQIATEGTNARVDFGADSAATRHLLEAGLPELASALRDAGMTLTGGGVSQHAQGGSQSGSDTRDESRGMRRMTMGVDGSSSIAAASSVRTQRGNLDLYA